MIGTDEFRKSFALGSDLLALNRQLRSKVWSSGRSGSIGLIGACIAHGMDRSSLIHSWIGNLIDPNEIDRILERGAGATGRRRLWWLTPTERYVLRDDVSDIFPR